MSPLIVVPPRRRGWEHAYSVAMKGQLATPFDWGAADCIARVCDLCEVMTGVNPLPLGERRYRSAAGAMRKLAQMGFAGVDEALSSVFPEIPKAMARRGDCGIAPVNVDGALVDVTFIVMGAQAVASNERGPVVIQTMQLRKTFQVG